MVVRWKKDAINTSCARAYRLTVIVQLTVYCEIKPFLSVHGIGSHATRTLDAELLVTFTFSGAASGPGEHINIHTI